MAASSSSSSSSISRVQPGLPSPASPPRPTVCGGGVESALANISFGQAVAFKALQTANPRVHVGVGPSSDNKLKVSDVVSGLGLLPDKWEWLSSSVKVSLLILYYLTMKLVV